MTPLTEVELHEWIADRDQAILAKDQARVDGIAHLLAGYGIQVVTRSDGTTRVLR